MDQLDQPLAQAQGLTTAPPIPSDVFVSTDELKGLLSALVENGPLNSNTLFIALHGYAPSRQGTLSVLTMNIVPLNIVALIDISALGSQAFTTESTRQENDGTVLRVSLKSILEDSTVRKCFWDVRNSTDALFSLCQIHLNSKTRDLQLMENCSRFGDKTFVIGFENAIKRHIGFDSPVEESRWRYNRRHVTAALKHADIFAVRPIDQETFRFCKDEVEVLPHLYSRYQYQLRQHRDGRTHDLSAETMRRIDEAKQDDY